MISLISLLKAQQKITEIIRDRRLSMGLTQEELAERSGVLLPTLRKFEQKNTISFESFLKLLTVVGGLDEMTNALKPLKPNFSSIDDVLNDNTNTLRKRGRKK